MNRILVFCFLLLGLSRSFGQAPPKPYGALPSQAQLNWHQMEMYCIIHFGVDTYTDKEWGFGDEDPAIFNPTGFDAMQIVAAAKAGGFKGVVIVAKHHDGFCIWPTKTTEHNITKSPWKDGKGDMLKEYQLACQKLDMQLGLYCSPWDRNNPAYGTPEYIRIYRAQLKELYANYGPIFISWHDGANGGDGYYGGNKDERKIDRTVYYGWDTTWAMIRKWQPTAAIFGDIGPDVRWVGNEAGEAGKTCWATYSPNAPDAGKKPSNGYSKYWEATEGTPHGVSWMPAECDVPLRPGWFYHQSQDEQVKSPYQLLELYYKSVGRGADLDLGLSPDRRGLINERDVASLTAFGKILKQTFAVNLAKGARFTASNTRGNNPLKYGPSFLTDNDRYSYWATDDSVTTPQLIVNFGIKKTFNVIRLREDIKLGQRIRSFAVDAFENNKWTEIASATSIGANRLIRLPQNITTSKIRLRIIGSDACIALSDFGLFKEPSHLTTPVISRDKDGMVSITTGETSAIIRYTVDGTNPKSASPVYQHSFSLPNGGLVKACSFDASSQHGEISAQQFDLVKSGWQIISNSIENNVAPEIIIDEPVNTTNKVSRPQISIDMGTEQVVKAFTYSPGQDKKSGLADQYILYVSNNGRNWQQVSRGEFANIRSNPVTQVIQLPNPVRTRYFKFSALHMISGNSISLAQIGVRVN